MRCIALFVVLSTGSVTPTEEPIGTLQQAVEGSKAVGAPAEIRRVDYTGHSFTATVAIPRGTFVAREKNDTALLVHYSYPSKGELQLAASGLPLRSIKELPTGPKDDASDRVLVEIETALPLPADVGSKMLVDAHLAKIAPMIPIETETVTFSLDVGVPCDLDVRDGPAAEATAGLFDFGMPEVASLSFTSPEVVTSAFWGDQRFHYREGTRVTLTHGNYDLRTAMIADVRQWHYGPGEAQRCRNRDRTGVPFTDLQMFLHIRPYSVRVFSGLDTQLLVGEFSLALNEQVLETVSSPCLKPPCT